MSDNIKVVVKVRPLISREIEEKLSYQWRVKNNTLYQIDQNGRDLGQAFTFDKVYDKDTETSDVYNDIAKPIVQAATGGFNGTIFAYGQTSSGKTYTMTGTELSPGIIPLAVLNLFEIIKSIPDRDFLVRVSYIEIYNETVKDLLNVDNNNIKVHETHQGIKVDATEKVTSSPEEVLEAMKEGEANRQKGATNMNEQSSRSHSIFQITIESREHIEGESEGGCVNVSQLNLVDLAGSERAGQTGATGIRFKEGTHINKSLSALALVIKQLSDDPNKYANYRDSKLTRILQNSLGGNAKTSIICAVTPAAVEETISTLQFANRAKAIKNKPEVNAVATDATMIQRLTKQMSKLQSQLESKKNLEQDNFNLQRQINALQRLILNGFAERRSIDVFQGPRRKLQAPRRVTIHSTLTSMDDEPVVNVPKFCTPSLKYNPMSLPNPSDFVPIQSSNKLASVPEEPARLITPPPHKAVNFNDEIITLDSDDEATPGGQETCSPIHKCYGASKTPPCILRKNCKIAEKNLKDIVELTEREKIYAPSTVELIEKIEQNSSVIAKLQDEIELLNKRSKEKDMQVELLKDKIQKNDDELKALCSAKDDLQSQCDSYSTKLTDWEVSYETLKTRAKLREEELLSLLEEVKVKKAPEIGKVLSRTFEKDIPFMDMSKDISLVNSDNENSINPEDEAEDINNIITETQNELASKNISIIELEAKLFANKQEIETLENLTEQLEQTVSTYKEKLSTIENENTMLKSSIDSLNTTISNQRQNLESANNDIKSYQHVIQELQIKLTQKDNTSDIRIDDCVLEEMITNEKHFIANNENMMNIVHSFKIALDTRNKEIAELRNRMDNESVPSNNSLTEELQTKTDQINMLHETIEDLKKQLNENAGTIRKLMHEKSHFQTIEQELITKLDDFQNKYSELEKNYNENNLSRVALEDKNNDMANQIEELNNKLVYLEDSVDKKKDLINSLNKDVTESRENLFKANIAVIKTKSILGSLSGNIAEVPDIMDNFVNIFSVLTNSLNTLEIAASDVIIEKQELNQLINNLKAEMEQLSIKHESEVVMLQEEIESLKQRNEDLKDKLNEAIEIRDLEISVNKSKTEQLEQTLIEKGNEICNLTSRLNDMEIQLREKISEINNYEAQLNKENKGERNLLTNISKKITDITNNFRIKNQLMEDLVDTVQIYEHILFTLDQIASHITFISQKNDDDDNNQASELIKLQNKILELTQENYDLTASLSEVEYKSSELKAALDLNQDGNKKLSESLKGSQELLHDLHTELKMKDTELDTMNDKVREFKMQFETLDLIMKEQMEEIKIENKNLVTRVNNLKRRSKSPDCDDGHQDVAHTMDSIAKVDTSSPPSLLTICCNKIVDHMEPKESESKTSTTLSADIEIQSELNICKCNQLQLELKDAEEENSRILDLMAQLEMMNENLLEEQDIIRTEMQLLLQPAQELQKKILNHRTNLSILTATTYTENKLLKSQVKVLQHHHKRFHDVCQRDIPDVKKQLSSLMTLLKGDVSAYDQQNLSFKRYSLPDVLDRIDSNTSIANFKNESTLDGDLLMLDTNVTLTTAADNTLAGHDQTCLDMPQYYSEACCQTNDFNPITDENVQQIGILDCDSDILGKLSILQEENVKLRALVQKYSELKQATTVTDAQNSPIKNGSHLDESVRKSFIADENSVQECEKCKELSLLKDIQDKLNTELKALGENLINIKSQKAELEEKYNNLILEKPSTEVLIKKLSIYEKEFNSQKQEISKLNDTIITNNKKLKGLQEENDTLSNQVMENISEVDDLQKVLDNLKQRNVELEGKCNQLEQSKIDNVKAVDDICSECVIKDKLIQTLQQSKPTKTHARLNRSLSDSDTSSRYNKICTLQSELHAGREDCKELTEDVVTIKNHLERSNLSMDLDESIGDGNVYTLNNDYEVSSPQSKKCNMPDIAEECNKDIYVLDKIDCYNYYVEKTGAQRNNVSHDTRIIEFMKMLYNHLIIKHGNEVENLTNKLRDYEEGKSQLQSQYNNLVEKYSEVTKELQEKQECTKIESTLSQLRNNISVINKELTTVEEIDNTKLLSVFKENLALLDSEFSLTSANIFELLINKMVKKQQSELADVMDKYAQLQANMENVSAELNTVTNNVLQIKTQLSTKEDEYNLLKAQKERVHEISNAVTLDIVKREKELKDTIDNGYQKLIEMNVVKKENVDSNLPLNTNINVLFELLITQNDSSRDKNNDKETLSLEINNLNKIVEEKQKEIDVLKVRCEKMQEVNNGVTLDLVDKDNKLQTLRTAHDDLNKTYEVKLHENNLNLLEIEKLTKEINILKHNIVEKENTIERLEKESQSQHEVDAKISELIERVSSLHNENENLKKINEIINKEKDSYAEELLRSGETIKKSNVDIDKMTSDILVLRESVRENSAVIENLTAETKSLMKQNLELKEQLEYKVRECSRLETNIKTHEKTAQIQARMITRIEKQKSDDEKALSDTKQQLEEITQKYVTLQKEKEDSKAEIKQMRDTKETLEARVSELEGLLEGQKNRLSVDAISDSSRRRRRSLYDCKRIFAEEKHDSGVHTNAEELFGSRAKPDDLFMDVDDEGSNRSTPIRLSKGRDSLSVSRTDQTKAKNDKMRRKLQVIQQGKVLSDKDEEPLSRPSSVVEIRRRRQTLHDSHRSELSHTPSPHGGNESTVSQLRERLTSCQQELEELKEKYRELDEECETCAEYLRERDAQCSQLKKDKISLQTQITELKEKLSSNPNVSSSKCKVADASVNTDKDWANLHSVVVDRMSYDAEVEKNKKLTKTIEELRFKQQDLKNTLAKMQKALEKNIGNRELEFTKSELEACRQELSELKERYKELDEECETCARYLREQEELCRRLKEAKTQLEAKLEEWQSSAAGARGARRRRQSAHDQARAAAADVSDAATETSDDFLSYQVERDGNTHSQTEDKHAKEVQYLKLAVERLTQQKSLLEQQFAVMQPALPPMYVATGSAIVQNQQITDVMKENHKLKKINAKLINLCKKRGKESNRENEDPGNQG